MTDHTTPTPPETPLESWKAIAAYLNRDARTVMRWEKSEGLPVHRHRHLARSTVYAFPSELDAWRANRRVDPPVAQSVGGGLGSRLLAMAAMLVLSLLSAGGGRFMGPVMAQGTSDQRVGWPDNARMAISATMSPDGRLMTSVDADDRELHVRDVLAGTTRTLTSIAASGGAVSASAISNDGTRVAIASKDAGPPALP
jgi:hypothetical protein